MGSTSITESVNELTSDMDVLPPSAFLRLLRQSDAQIFNGYKGHASVYDSEVLLCLTAIIHDCLAAFDRFKNAKKTENTGNTKRGKVKIVLSGAGTSGRIAFFIAKAFNLYFPSEHYFHYLIAGGDKALIVGQEGSEDDVKAAVVDLKAVLADDTDTVIYVGITCGLSAPYVAAQLDYLFSLADEGKTEVVSVLMGFNPVELARKNVIEHWHRSFYDVTLEMQKRSNTPSNNNNKFYILNPVYGPEPLTGSTRMKGGTVTKLLLEVIFSIVYHRSFSIPLVSCKEGNSTTSSVPALLISLIGHYERTCRETYLKLDQIAPLVQNAGDSLRSTNKTGHVYYIGGYTLGILSFIDASETVPTFGASYEEIRAFILDVNDGEKTLDAWGVLGNREGDMSSFGPQYTVTQAFFEQHIEPTITENDTVILFNNSSQEIPYIYTLAKRIKTTKPSTKVALVSFGVNTTNTPADKESAFLLVDDVLQLDLPYTELLPGMPSFIEMSTKWILNAISTGGFVLQGKVFQNRMIDLGITNHKLFHRACGIVSKFGDVDLPTATLNVLRAIYSLEASAVVPDAIQNAPISDHVRKVNQEAQLGNTKMVATALLLCTGKFTIAAAKQALIADPIVRNILL